MHQRLLYAGAKPSRLIYASFTTVEKDFAPVSHSHPNTEIIYVSDGEGYIVTQNGKTKLTKGDCAVINGISEHREESVNGKELTFYAIGVTDYGFTNASVVEVFTPNSYDGQTLARSFKGVFEELKQFDALWEDVVNLYTELICAFTSRYTRAQKGLIQRRGTTLVENTKRIIDNRYYAPIKPESIAASLSVSYSTLIHTFKNETGKTITEYKLSKQITEAKSLLSLTDMNVSQIALNVGFGTNTYFSKIFKRETGETPKQYRERIKKSAKKDNN